MHVTEKRRGRGRPRSFDVDAALDRAVDVFWKHGYEGADLDTLTEAMGINRPSLYAAYGDKRALFFTAVERYYQTVAMLDLPAVTGGRDCYPSHLSKAIIRLFYDHERPRGCLIACVLADVANTDEDAKAILKDLIEREERRIERWANAILPKHAEARGRCFATLLIALLHSTAIKADAGVPRRQAAIELHAAMSVVTGILDSDASQ